MRPMTDRIVPGIQVLALLACAMLPACKEHARLSGAKISHVDVGTVIDQGITLDEDASPKQVGFVLLQAIRDDVLAGNDRETRQAAIERQLNVCAADTIYTRHQRYYGGSAGDRDEKVYESVCSWAPTLARYVKAFPSDWPSADEQLHERIADAAGGEGANSAVVFLEVPDPEFGSSASVIIEIDVVRETGKPSNKGGGRFWRVVRVGFYPERRHLRSNAAGDQANDGSTS